jgi:hypothetical protein
MELESTAKWTVNIIGYEGSMGNQGKLLIDQKKELQPSKLHKKSQLVEKLEEVI